MNWAVTIGKSNIESFQAEIQHAKQKPLMKNFKIPPHIKAPQAGDVVYIVYAGAIRGRMPLIRREMQEGFTCETTSKNWGRGNYLVCDITQYVELPSPIPMKGFQGIKKIGLGVES